MKITLEHTADIERVQGVLCRVWIGQTAAGVPVKCWICVIQPQTHDADQLAAFEAALKEMPYRRELVSFDLRMVT